MTTHALVFNDTNGNYDILKGIFNLIQKLVTQLKNDKKRKDLKSKLKHIDQLSEKMLDYLKDDSLSSDYDIERFYNLLLTDGTFYGLFNAIHMNFCDMLDSSKTLKEDIYTPKDEQKSNEFIRSLELIVSLFAFVREEIDEKKFGDITNCIPA